MAARIRPGILSATKIVDSPGTQQIDPQLGAMGIVTRGAAFNQVTLVQSALLALGVQTALTNISTAQNLLSFSLPGGSLNKLGRTFQVNIWGIYSFAGGSTPTISIALKIGSVTICTLTSTAINTAASTNLQFQASFQVTVSAIGATATVEAHGTLSINLSANTPGAAMSQFVDGNTAASSAIDLTTAQNLVATIASSGTLSGAQVRSATVELVA